MRVRKKQEEGRDEEGREGEGRDEIVVFRGILGTSKKFGILL